MKDYGDGTVRFTCAETAKFVRKALKAAFPGVKFSVRSSNYAGGASIHVDWVDGPTGSAVDAVAGVYAGADFDGMIDLKSYKEHWMEADGTVHIARASGTESSMGCQPERIEDPRTPGARLVTFGADFVICQRRRSPEFEAEIIAYIERTYALGTPGNRYDPNARYGNGWASDLVHRCAVLTAAGEPVKGWGVN